jgi:diguanylate cyclase (GGDEF)-like protein
MDPTLLLPAPGETPARPPKVLLADDERLGRGILERWLREWGYEVVSVGDGEAALAALANDPDLRLAILDWIMPKLTGPEACRKIRTGSQEPYVYVVLLTARDDKEHVIEGLEAGADDYLTKPCNPLELKVRLRAGQRVIDLQRELIQAREKLRYEAMHDALTGLLNRSAVMSRLEQELARSARLESHVSVIMTDLDHFKAVNDTYGHAAGDSVLREASRRLKCAIRTYDVVGRVGGEEFLYVGSECGNRDGRSVAERLRRMVAAGPVQVPGHMIKISGSFGVASTEQRAGATAEQLLRAADAALYRAKQGGRDRVELANQVDWAAL